MSLKFEDMATEELRRELELVKECLLDIEEIHVFSLTKTSVHIGSAMIHGMQEEYEGQSREYRERIARIGEILQSKAEQAGEGR